MRCWAELGKQAALEVGVWLNDKRKVTLGSLPLTKSEISYNFLDISPTSSDYFKAASL